MKRTVLSAMLSAAALATALTAAPAMAQGYTPPAGDPVEYQTEDYPYEDYAGDEPPAEAAYEGGDPGNGAQVDVEYVETARYAGDRRRIRPGDYVDPNAIDGRTYRPGRERCRGDTGAIIGGIAGALIGGGDGDGYRGRGRYRHNRGGSTVGALIGGGLGALLGSEIEKDACRRSR